MTGIPFQFTLRRMLLASAFVACACAVAGWIYRNYTSSGSLEYAFGALLLAHAAIGGSLGAAIGTLTKNVTKGAIGGLAVAAVVFIIVIAPAFAPVIFWSP